MREQNARLVLRLAHRGCVLETGTIVVQGMASRKAIIMLLGLAGGTLPYSFLALPSECVLANSVWGTYNELKELLALAAMGKIKANIKRFPLKDINDVFSDMRKGRIEGQAVITP